MEAKKVTVVNNGSEFHYNGKAYPTGADCVMLESEFIALTQTNAEKLNLSLKKESGK